MGSISINSRIYAGFFGWAVLKLALTPLGLFASRRRAKRPGDFLDMIVISFIMIPIQNCD